MFDAVRKKARTLMAELLRAKDSDTTYKLVRT
jgi:hypothetical protein